MFRRRYFLILSLVAGLSFWVFSLIASKRPFVKLDFDLTVKLQDKLHTKADSFLEFVSLTASFDIVIVVLLVVLGLNRKLISVLILPIFALAHIVEIYGKALINHPGPPVMFLRNEEITFFPKWYVLTESSYPSGHAMRVVFLAILTVMLFARAKYLKKYRYLSIPILLGWVGLVMLSRVVLGQHWSTDVIGGSLLGMSLAFLSLVFF